MKRRLGSKMSTGFLFMERPFFDVDIELKVPDVVMNPRVDDIQAAINTIAKRMLQSSKLLQVGARRCITRYAFCAPCSGVAPYSEYQPAAIVQCGATPSPEP